MITAETARINTANARCLSAGYGREYALCSLGEIEEDIIQKAKKGEYHCFFFVRIPDTCEEYEPAQRARLQDTPVDRKFFFQSCFDALDERLTHLGYHLKAYEANGTNIRTIIIYWSEPNS